MAKTRQEKEAMMGLYQDIIKKNNFVILKIGQIPAHVLAKVRKQLNNQDGALHLLKNKIFAIALDKVEGIPELELDGNLLILDGGSDISSALKAVEDSVQDVKEFLALKGMEPEEIREFEYYTYQFGYVDGRYLDGEKVKRLLDLPPRDVLLGQVANVLQAPISGFMNVLQGNVRDFTYALNALKEQKS